MRYAFEENRPGTIRISMKEIPNGGARLVIADDGKRVRSRRVSEGLGMKLTIAMMRQLGGTCRYTNDDGARFEADISAELPGATRGERVRLRLAFNEGQLAQRTSPHRTRSAWRKAVTAPAAGHRPRLGIGADFGAGGAQEALPHEPGV